MKAIIAAVSLLSLSAGTAMAGSSYNVPAMVEAIVTRNIDGLGSGGPKALRLRAHYLAGFSVHLHLACGFLPVDVAGQLANAVTREFAGPDQKLATMLVSAGAADAEMLVAADGCGSGLATMAHLTIRTVWSGSMNETVRQLRA